MPDVPVLERCSCGSPVRVYVERECLGCGTLSLYDVHNVDAFVKDAIYDGGARLSPAQREEMQAEGRRIMLRLARQYQPGKGGRDAELSRFSGYAAKYLRLKLSDAYARVVQRDDANGDPAARRPVSLNVLHDVAAQNGDVASADGSYLEQVMREIDHMAALSKRYVALALEGVDEAEAAGLMRVERAQVRAVVASLRLALGGK
jgi:hypothetical protein